MTDQGIENLTFVSASARFNTERRPLLRGYFDHVLQSGEIFDKPSTEADISEYWESQELDSEQSEKWFRQLLLMYPDDPEIQDYQFYLNIRYSDLSEQIRDVVGFSAVDLISFEAFLYNQIVETADDLGIASSNHTFSEKEEFARTGEFERPTETFQNKWLPCIEFSRSELIDEFLVQTEDQSLSQSLSITERIDSVNSMVNHLTKEFEKGIEYSPLQFLKTPIFEIKGKDDRLLVPFPALLVSTVQMRIEELFRQQRDLQELEDDTKGDLVEELALDALAEFDSRNIVQSFKYTDPHPRETDGLLLFENSFWSIEVKSHPIFRKLPEDLSVALSKFEDKVTDAKSQGEKSIDFLKNEGSEILYHLAGVKSPDEKRCGTIIVLDGLLPTLFSQNRRIDQIFEMDRIYDAFEEDDRVLIITLFDLFELAQQFDELDRLEDFLIWRTDYGFDMPVFSFNERDYWAMYFDNYESDPTFQNAIDEAAKNGSMIAYISERFNDKPHLPEEGF